MFNDLMDTIGFVEEKDPEVGQAMEKELARQRRNLELIASENIVSPAVMAAMGSVLTNKYAEGYPSKRYYGGCQCVDIVEEIARRRACKMCIRDSVFHMAAVQLEGVPQFPVIGVAFPHFKDSGKGGNKPLFLRGFPLGRLFFGLP